MSVLRCILLTLLGLVLAAAITSGAGARKAPVVVPTAGSLPCGDYPWAQPLWVTTGGVTLPKARAAATAAPAALVGPGWATVEGITAVVVPTLASLPCGRYPWAQPLWITSGGVERPTLR